LTRRALAPFVLGALSIPLAGCSFGEHAEDRAIIAAIGALRDASSDDLGRRMRLVEELEKKPATSALGRRARDACASAYRTLVEGQEAADRVRRGLAGPASEAPKNLLADLAASEEKIRKAEAEMPSCEKAAAELGLSRR